MKLLFGLVIILDLVDQLLKFDSAVKARAPILHWIIYWNHWELAAQLVQYGADPNQLSECGISIRDILQRNNLKPSKQFLQLVKINDLPYGQIQGVSGYEYSYSPKVQLDKEVTTILDDEQ